MDVRHKGKNSYPERTKSRVVNSYDRLTSNDIRYYNKHPEDLRNAARVEWAEYMGVPFAFNKLADSHIPAQPISGIVATDVMTGPGGCSVATDSVNRAFHMMMSDMYGRTSASNLNFDQGTLAMFYSGAASISNVIAYAKRAIKTVTFWVSRNINYPRALVEAMGIDYDDLVQHKANYLIQLNEEIAKFNTFGILQSFDVYGREYSMFNNIYIDEDSDLAQIYIFKPLNYYIYSDTEGKCVYHECPWNNVRMTRQDFTKVKFSEVLTIIDTMIEAWRTSQDFFYVTGTINRAYPNEPRMVIDGVSEQETIDPIVDDVMMMQLMNATYVRGTYLAENAQGTQRDTFQNSVNIKSDPVTGVISWGPMVGYGNLDIDTKLYLTADYRMLRMYNDSPSEDDIVEMTRLTVANVQLANSFLSFPLCSPEILASSLILTFDMSANTCLNISGPCKFAWIVSNVFTTFDILDPDQSVRFSAYTGVYNGSWRRVSAGTELTLVNDIWTLFKLQPFRYIPLVLLIDRKQATSSAQISSANPDWSQSGALSAAANANTPVQSMPMGDLYNYTKLGSNQYESLQRVCLRSLYEPTFVKGG